MRDEPNFKYKIESYSHSEHDNERLKSIDYVNGFIKNSCVIVEVDDTFPDYVRENYSEFVDKGYFLLD